MLPYKEVALMKRESVAYETGDLLIHTADGIEYSIIKVTRKSLPYEFTVVGRIIYTTDKGGFLEFAINEKLEFQCLKKHCTKL